MTAVWASDESGWQLLAPTGFPDEATLHSLVEDAPHLLPLSGRPQLVVVGREVQLGTGRTRPDLVAIEPDGRVVLIEVKLAANDEARRAVVSQILSYAALLFRMDAESLERDVLSSHLQQRGYLSLAHAVASNFQEGNLDEQTFRGGLADSLRMGRFRLVLVLDAAPQELVQLVGYLEAVTGDLVIDLVTVAAYDVNGTQVIVPQRVDPERQDIEPSISTARSRLAQGSYTKGADEFAASIDSAPEERRVALKTLLEWARELESRGFATLGSHRGLDGSVTLLPKVRGHDAAMVTIWNFGNRLLSFWRSVFEKRAPHSLATVEATLAPAGVGQGNTVNEIVSGLLEALTDAYREAATPADTVIVAAAAAWPEYNRYGAYICQPGRSFRDGLSYLGFYADKEIKPVIPRILLRKDGVTMSAEHVAQLRGSASESEHLLADVVGSVVHEGSDRAGKAFQVFLLSRPDAVETLELPSSIQHEGTAAWVQGQRYALSERLVRAHSTADL